MHRLTRRQFLTGLGAGATLASLPRQLRADPLARKPNVVIILTDDLGWMDTGVYGSTFFQTPHIDALAAGGMRFTNGYSSHPLCSPTRASLLTGLWPHRIGITVPVGHLPDERIKATLETSAPAKNPRLEAVSATRLDRKYQTLAEDLRAAGYATGHFGKWHLGKEPFDPLHQGFDVDVPHDSCPGPAGGYLAPWKFKNFTGKPGEHIEDRMAREAGAFIRKHRDRPFYLNYWAYSVHSPWGGKEEYIRAATGKAAPDAPQRNPVMHAMIRSLDDAVGRLVATLKETGVYDNTIILFTSDNGGVNWVPVRSDTGSPYTSNAPLRGGKANLYEGGVRVPWIVSWPGQVAAGVSDALIQTLDVRPTILDLAGLPAGEKMDGVSFRAALTGGKLERDTLFWHFPHDMLWRGHSAGSAIRQGDWKLIRYFAAAPDGTDRHELYNLRDDPGETRDLAGKMTDRVQELGARLTRHLQETSAIIPQRNPAFGSKP